MKYTLILILATVLAYFSFSSLTLFIPSETIAAYGLSSSNPIGSVVYFFMHISVNHLLANIFLLFAVGIVVEEKLKWREYYSLYFISGISAGLIFAMLSPNSILIGASAAIAGLIIPACLIDFKKTIAYIAIFTVVAVLATFLYSSVLSETYNSSKTESFKLEQSYNQTVVHKAAVVQNISVLDNKFNRGEVNITEYNQTKQALIDRLANISREEIIGYQQMSSSREAVLNLEEGVSREKLSFTSGTAHIFGSLIGLGFIALFRRDIVWNSGYQVLKFERWLKKLRKKSKKRT